jgi:phage shock protein PspC (stress-responsive transcriptional regulator)
MDDTATPELEHPTPAAESDEPTTEAPAGEQPAADEAPRDTAGGLRRSTSNKVIGGVCGGLAERYDVDANIVRVVFVVLAVLWGLGVAVYLVMWLVVPRSGAEPASAPPEPTSAASRHWLTIAVVVGVLALAAVVASTLGGAPRAGSGIATLWLIFLIVLAVVAVLRPSRKLTLRRIFALAFLVVVSGVILVVGIFATTIAATGVPLEGGIGQRTWTPTSVAELQSSYRLSIGKAEVDLTRVPFTSQRFGVTASVGAGQLVIDVPANAVIDLRTRVGMGRTEQVQEFTLVKAPGGVAAHLVIDAQVGLGEISVQRVAYARG